MENKGKDVQVAQASRTGRKDEIVDGSNNSFTRCLRRHIINQVEKMCDYATLGSKVDVTNPEFHLPSKVIITGAEASTLLKKLSKNHPIAKEFQISLMKAYTNTAQHMKQKLPPKNSYLISFTALDPELRGKTNTILAF
ncbi:hypothetical protein TNCV_1174241 [Trichonephila clavipes]|nr:hypothetical protein TNCV_1174241 [Trichonephila clavipes]